MASNASKVQAREAHDPPLSVAGLRDIGLFGGYHVYGEENELGAEDNQIVGTIDDGPIFGLRVAYWFVDRLAIEAEGGIFLTNPRIQFSDLVLGFHYRGQILLREGVHRAIEGEQQLRDHRIRGDEPPRGRHLAVRPPLRVPVGEGAEEGEVRAAPHRPGPSVRGAEQG